MTELNPENPVVLVADSDAQAVSAIRSSLAGSGHTLIEAGSVAEVIDLVDLHHPALVISELDLPDGSGFSLCRQLRLRESTVLMLMISRWGHEADRILAFECGADDFMTKPFFGRELASRTRALLRRGGRYQSPFPAQIVNERQDADPGIVINREEREVTVSGQRIDFTPREFGLLLTLMDGRGRVFSRAELIGDCLSEHPAPGIRSVDAHIKSIRQKLGKFGHSIATIRGIGYRYKGLNAHEESIADSVRD